MRKSRLVKHLEQLSEEELREEILRLYEQNKEVQSFYAMELGTSEERQKKYNKAKKQLDSKFISRSTRRVRRPRINPAKKIIKELERTAIFKHEMIDIHLYACEIALAFGEAYYFSSIPLYNFIQQQHNAAYIICENAHLQAEYKSRFDNIYSSLPSDLILEYP